MKPSASSTSAEPELDDTARLPCFATPAPAAAATSAAAVEMLSVCALSPPVPAVSTRSCALRVDSEHVLAHRLRAAGDLARGLALEAQSDEEAAHLRLRRLAVHDRAHHVARLGARQVVALEQTRDRALDHEMKFLSRSLPSGVSTDSGWNCTPSIGSSRCRTPITSPSSLRAEISSTSGTRVAASEW